MVRLHASSLGLDAGFGLLDAADAADLLDLVREDHGQAQSRRRFPRAQTMLDIYSRTVNSQAPLAQVLAESFELRKRHRMAVARCLPCTVCIALWRNGHRRSWAAVTRIGQRRGAVEATRQRGGQN